MVDDNKVSPPETGEKEQKTVTGDSGGPATKVSTEAPLNLPEKLKGKSGEEITKMYLELERKAGEQSATVSEAKELKKQTDTLLRAIWSNPELYRQVEHGINTYLSGEGVPDTRGKPSKPDGGEEAAGTGVSPEVADLRKATENRILDEFRSEYGYNNLPEKENQEKFTKTAVVLAEILDPSGKKSVAQIVKGIPLNQLPKYLRYAHRIAHFDNIGEQAKRSALASVEENRAAAIGSFPASSGQAKGSIQLSEREREVARKMGISEEDYAKQKMAISAENRRFE